MATSPMMQGFADSEMPEDGMIPDDNQAGTVELCIQVAPDGTMTVYKEMPGQDGAQQEGQRQPAASIGEALKMVLDLYKSMEPGNGDAAFQAGYSADEPEMQRPMGRNMARGMA